MAQKYGFELETYGLQVEELQQAIESVEGLEYYGHFPSYHGSRSLGLRCKENGNGNLWVSERDGSIDGDKGLDHEVISPIVEGREGIETVCRVINALRRAGALINDNCGLHITFGLENSHARWNRFSAKKKAQVIIQIVELLEFYKDELHHLLPERRNCDLSSHARTYCRLSSTRRDRDRLGLHHASATYGVQSMIDYERGALNVESLFTKGIIEFRSLEMTFDTHRVRTFALLLHKIVTFAIQRVNKQDYEPYMNYYREGKGLLDVINAGSDLKKAVARMATKNLLQEFGVHLVTPEAV